MADGPVKTDTETLSDLAEQLHQRGVVPIKYSGFSASKNRFGGSKNLYLAAKIGLFKPVIFDVNQWLEIVKIRGSGEYHLCGMGVKAI